MFVQSSLVVLAATSLLPSVSSRVIQRSDKPSVQLIHRFGSNIFLGPMVVRPNGHILPHEQFSNMLHEINPFDHSSINSHTFAEPDNSDSEILSLAAVGNDLYVANVMHCKTDLPGMCPPSNVTTYTLDYRTSNESPVVKSLAAANWTGLGSDEGVMNIGEGVPVAKDLLLLADGTLGNIWKLNVTSGETEILFTDSLLEPVQSAIGADTLRLVNDTLYFTNGAQNLLGRVQIDLSNGNKLGNATVVSHDGSFVAPSGFEVDETYAYVADVQANAVWRVTLATGKQELFHRMNNPTGVRFGLKKDDVLGGKRRMFVSTSGGYTQGGAIYALDF